MNIFFLALNPQTCAKYHCDAHCVKMILEACQLLWTAFHLTGTEEWEHFVPPNIKVYKPTHKNHPTAIWVRSSEGNFRWTSRLAFELCLEYTERYGKRHACQDMAEWFLNNMPECDEKTKAKPITVYPTKNIPENCTPPPLAMPTEYHCDDLIEAYRDYYRGDKRRFAKWKNGKIPDWFQED
jgi:hypothetical protein